MTTIEFMNRQGRIEGFTCKGHSGYAEQGADIVCAAVSTAVQFATATICDVLGISCKTRVKEDTAEVFFQLPPKCEEEDAAQAVLSGMMLTLSALHDEYPDYLEVLEV